MSKHTRPTVIAAALLAAAGAHAAPPGSTMAVDIEALAADPAEVGDAESFGRNMKWLGLLQTGNLSLREDCTPPPGTTPGPDDRCIVLNPAPAVTSFSEPDLGRITLPGKSAHSLFCQWVTPFLGFSFFNGTGSSQLARVAITPMIRIENEVLNDPGLTDPNTGLPLAGAIESGLSASHFEQRTIGSGEQEFKRLNYTRTCIGGIVSHNFLSAYGLSEAQIKQFFKKPTTMRVGVSGSVSMVDDASFFYGVRFVGD